MGFRFEKLTVWQDARAFANLIYRITKTFPSEEKFGLINQLRRASISVCLNIAEGSDKKSDAEFRRFLRMAIGSCEEVVTALYIAMDQKYIDKKNFDIIYEDANRLVAKINALIKSLNKL
ncbi:MAG: four helix bundle protein [Patescibacteria group bacterium]